MRNIDIHTISGVIAEFNPLHRGHEALMKFAKSPENSACVVILSSNFTQRGSPAILDKFTRATMAIKAGADLVIELPFLYACAAGSDFARGAVNLLARTKFADNIVFGMEDTDFDVMPLVDIMLREDQGYRKFLRDELNSGASFVKANSIALEKLLPGSHDFITKPNNMLALLYIMNIRRGNYNLKVLPIKRKTIYKSSVIRENLHDALTVGMMPEFVSEILCKTEREGRISNEQSLWPLLQNIFIRSSREDLQKIYGIDEGIENLFMKNWRFSRGLDDFMGRCVCARYTRAHIRRRLIYILLGLERWEVTGALRGNVPYARVLAFNDVGREILRERARDSDVKIITRLVEADDIRGKYFAGVEFRASWLYELLLRNTNMNNETRAVIKF